MGQTATTTGRNGDRTLRITTSTAALLALAVLTACAEPDAILPGERFGPREVLDPALAEASDPANRALPLALVAPQAAPDSAQSPVSPFARTDHASLGTALQQVMAAKIGQGDTRRARLNVDPVVAGGRIFTLDSAHQLSALSLSGQVLWQKSMVPSRDQAEQAQGGGLAVAEGRLYVASGFGRVSALDPATGAEIWVQQLGGTATGAPTVRDGLVYLTSSDSIGWTLEAETGRIRWQIENPEDLNNMAGAPAPAVDDRLVVFAFGSGAVQAALRQGGLRIWSADVVGRRTGVARATVTDITGDPLIAGNRIYAGNQSGRLVALEAGSGERLWTARMGALDPVWPAGDSVFLVSDENRLVRLDAATGEQIWAVDLPGYVPVRKPQRRRDAAFVNHGPVLAGGRLIVASSDGALRSFDPVSGALLASAPIPGGATTRPVIANGTLYVISRDGMLLAYR